MENPRKKKEKVNNLLTNFLFSVKILLSKRYDEAIIAALALKYIGNIDGLQMIFRALNMLEKK